MIAASLSEPHTSESFVLSTIHKKLRIKIGELTNASAKMTKSFIFCVIYSFPRIGALIRSATLSECCSLQVGDDTVDLSIQRKVLLCAVLIVVF